MRTFKARKGFRISDNQAQEFGERLSSLSSKNNGNVTPEIVVNDAENPKSPLHDYFEWDDSEAAKEWRLQQARVMMRSIEVVIETSSGDANVRAFFNVNLESDTDSMESVYVSVDRVLSEKELRKQVVAQALSEAENWSVRYKQYSELRPIVKAIVGFKKRKKKVLIKTR